MRLVIDLGAEVEFTEPLSGGPFPYLLEVGELRIAARAGYIAGLTTGESPSLTVTLDNAGNRAADIVAQPLRARATVYDGEDEFWSAQISNITYGRTIELTLDI